MTTVIEGRFLTLHKSRGLRAASEPGAVATGLRGKRFRWAADPVATAPGSDAAPGIDLLYFCAKAGVFRDGSLQTLYNFHEILYAPLPRIVCTSVEWGP